MTRVCLIIKITLLIHMVELIRGRENGQSLEEADLMFFLNTLGNFSPSKQNNTDLYITFKIRNIVLRRRRFFFEIYTFKKEKAREKSSRSNVLMY